MTFYLLKYNNYYNRILKRFLNLYDYLKEPYYSGDFVENINFDPNDGVNTFQIVNSNYDADYALLVDDGEIVSRWFVIETKRLRNRQYRLQLRRDLIADNYDAVINSPCFIEKATLNDSDPMILNSEDITFNQIKKGEKLLKDETGCAWIVGYFATSDAEGVKDYTVETKKEIKADISVNNLQSFEFYKYINKNYAGTTISRTFKTRVTNPNESASGGDFGFVTHPSYSYDIDNAGNFEVKNLTLLFKPNLIPIGDPLQAGQNYLNRLKSNLDTLNALAIYYEDQHSEAEQSDLLLCNGKILADNSTSPITYYKINVQDHGIENISLSITDGSLFNTLNDLKNGILQGSPNSESYVLRYSTRTLYLTLEKIEEFSGSVTIQKNRYHLADAPYDMFAIPYSDDLKIYQNGAEIVQTSKEIAFNFAMNFARTYGIGSGKTLYDVQMLPYCPIRYLLQNTGEIDVKDDVKAYSLIKKTGTETNLGIVFYARQSSFTFNINEKIKVLNKKIENQTDFVRMCSPNYNGVFEFSPAKNDGVNFFNVDCTYLPYNPYIHINPDFKSLYGNDYNDSRGLNVGGDFSLPAISEAWANYQLSNKNYQQIFDRQIQNMEVNNSVQKEREVVGAVAGTLGGIAAGASAGKYVGGIGGGIVGGIVGGIASGLAGAEDVRLNDKLRNEALDYSKDMFGYQLGNIKALPNSLSKTSAFTANNKIFPFLEFYSCTDEEKEAFANKLKYNGMTVMRIGKIKDFIRLEQTYIKGQLIRVEDLKGDTNYINEIANEINKGVYI